MTKTKSRRSSFGTRSLAALGVGALVVVLAFAVVFWATQNVALAAAAALVPALWLLTRRAARQAWRRLRGRSGTRGWGSYYSD